MTDKTFSQIGLDRSIPHIGVLMEKYDTDFYPKFVLPKGYCFFTRQRAYFLYDKTIYFYETQAVFQNQHLFCANHWVKFV
jgi:hypothetical protein